MFKYIVEFSKTGTICYTSHLDLMRVFKRMFKKAGIRQSYSQGFNPHPKMGFAQPLSLGYEGLQEYLEFETEEDYLPEQLLQIMQDLAPDGLDIKRCDRLEGLKKTLAAITDAAVYKIRIPLPEGLEHPEREDVWIDDYLAQEQIITLKKQKKKKELKEIDIKPMIRQLSAELEHTADAEETLCITAELDSGSISNLSPELVITTFLQYWKLDQIERSEVSVQRAKIIFDK